MTIPIIITIIFFFGVLFCLLGIIRLNILNFKSFDNDFLHGKYKKVSLFKKHIKVYIEHSLFDNFVLTCKSKKDLYDILKIYNTELDLVYYFMLKCDDYQKWLIKSDYLYPKTISQLISRVLKEKRKNKLKKFLN